MTQQPIELILIRQWASYLAMPIFVVDPEGNLVFYNEPAEALLGRRYEEAGEMPLAELDRIFHTTAEDGSALAPDQLPLGVALMQQRPAHGRLRFQGLDAVRRLIEVTAFPVEGQGGRLLGAVALFWEVEGR
jgi:PAS domain-containing protein